MKNIGDTLDHKHEKCDRICTNQVSVMRKGSAVGTASESSALSG
jgi:hypothetical protein